MNAHESLALSLKGTRGGDGTRDISVSIECINTSMQTSWDTDTQWK